MEEGQLMVEYRVKYKSNGIIPSAPRLQEKIKPGLQGTFVAEEGEEDGAREDADKAVAACKKFFNETETVETRVDGNGFIHEIVSETEFGPDGKPKSTRKITHKEIVIVWIERWRLEGGKRPVLIDSTEPKKPIPVETGVSELERLRAENETLKRNLAAAEQLLADEDEEEEELAMAAALQE